MNVADTGCITFLLCQHIHRIWLFMNVRWFQSFKSPFIGGMQRPYNIFPYEEAKERCNIAARSLPHGPFSTSSFRVGAVRSDCVHHAYSEASGLGVVLRACTAINTSRLKRPVLLLRSLPHHDACSRCEMDCFALPLASW